MTASMADPAALLGMLQISDSAFPSGAFAFSAGLETLSGEGRITAEDDMHRYLRDEILPRWLAFDRWFLAQGHGLGLTGCAALDRDCECQTTVSGLGLASRRVGRALLSTHARIGTPGAGDYLAQLLQGALPGHGPVVQGGLGRALALPLPLVEAGALHGTISAALSASVRLGIVGALGAQRIFAELRRDMAEGLGRALPDLPSSFSPLADIAAMRHGQNPTRLFAA